MLLSQLLQSEKQEEITYGIITDCECLTAPDGIKIAGFIYQEGSIPGRSISDQLLDAIITFNLQGIHVILEIPPEAKVDPDYIMMAAANAMISISLIPPDNHDGADAWAQQCASYVKPFLTTPNFSNYLMPVQGYFTFLIAEEFGGLDSISPSDEYVLNRFVNATATETSDQAKKKMKKAFIEAVGGESELKDLIRALVDGVGNEALRQLNDLPEN